MKLNNKLMAVAIAALLMAGTTVSSCSTTKHLNTPITSNNIHEHEWVTFDVSTKLHHGNDEGEEIYQAHVILHSMGDSVAELVVITPESKTILSPNRLTCINTDYQFIASYPNTVFWYNHGVVDLLQETMDYFPMYYPYNNNYRVSIDTNPISVEIISGDTLKLFNATKTEKHCYPDGYCELEDTRLQYTYSTMENAYIKASTCPYGKQQIHFVSSISNISFFNQSDTIDSVFNLNSLAYCNYDRLPENMYYPPQILFTTDTVMTDTVLDWPIVNLATGDTTTLRRMEGSTLLYLFNFNLDSSWYAEGQAAAGIADTLVWLMPLSNNTERLQQIVDTYHLGRNIYYTKGFTQHLSNEYRAYLIDSDHQTAACFNQERISLKEWIEALKKAKTQ